MSDTNERSVASAGSVAGKPVAWALQHKNGDMRIGMYFNPADAYEYAEACGDTVVPLYRHPPCQDVSQKNLTLTDAEREAIETAMNAYGSDNANPECAAIEATLWGLLERLK